MSDNVIKSVRRVFEILELFYEDREPLSAKEIAIQLNYPLASAHALLKSMHELGYADFDRSSWSYLPSENLMALVEWIPNVLNREIAILEFAKALNKETGETVNISRRVGAQMRIVRGFESSHPVGVSVKIGTMMPVLHSLTGIAAYASVDEKERRNIDKLSKNVPVGYRKSSEQDMDDAITELVGKGIVSRCDFALPGVGAICLPVRLANAEDIVVIGVVGPSDRIAENESKYRRITKKLASQFQLKPVFKIGSRIAA